MKLNRFKFLIVYLLAILLLCTIFYVVLMPKPKEVSLPPPQEAHIAYLAQYDWHIKKTTNYKEFVLYNQLFWVEQYKNMGLDLTPYINQEIAQTTYLLHEQAIEEDGKIYMSVYEHNGKIIGAMGSLPSGVPGYLPVEDKPRLIEENKLR